MQLPKLCWCVVAAANNRVFNHFIDHDTCDTPARWTSCAHESYRTVPKTTKQWYEWLRRTVLTPTVPYLAMVTGFGSTDEPYPCLHLSVSVVLTHKNVIDSCTDGRHTDIVVVICFNQWILLEDTLLTYYSWEVLAKFIFYFIFDCSTRLML